MGTFKKALHSKIGVFVKFESAINLEIRGQIKKKLVFLLFGLQDIRYKIFISGINAHRLKIHIYHNN